MIKRTQEQIADRYREQIKKLFGSFASSDLLEWLDYEHAKEFLKEDITSEKWQETCAGRAPVLDQMISYMDFAWEKANDCRGLSAMRSMQHYGNWLWLIGEDELAAGCENYDYYGKDQLRKICEFLKLDFAKWDDGRRVNSDTE